MPSVAMRRIFFQGGRKGFSLKNGEVLWEIRVFPSSKFAFRKSLSSTDVLLTISEQRHKALDCDQESYVIHDSDAAFDRDT